jgi:hypothetical protein
MSKFCEGDIDDIFGVDYTFDLNKDPEEDEEMKYHVAAIELSEIPLKHIERYLREKKLNLKKVE